MSGAGWLQEQEGGATPPHLSIAKLKLLALTAKTVESLTLYQILPTRLPTSSLEQQRLDPFLWVQDVRALVVTETRLHAGLCCCCRGD